MLGYFARKFWERISTFVSDWYIGGFKAVVNRAVEFLSVLDQTFAVKINLKMLFTPLYKDASAIGYLLGFFFRFFRVLIGGTIYVLIGLAAAAVYAAWAALPVFLLFQIATHFQ